MIGVINPKRTQTLSLCQVLVNSKCHENNYILHEISVIVHEPTILLRALNTLSVMTGLFGGPNWPYVLKKESC